jgi:hypothetical protein
MARQPKLTTHQRQQPLQQLGAGKDSTRDIAPTRCITARLRGLLNAEGNKPVQGRDGPYDCHVNIAPMI